MNIFQYYLVVILGLFLGGCGVNSGPDNSDGKNVHSAQELWDIHAGRLRSLFAVLDFEQPNLKPVHNSLLQADTAGAAEKLVNYFSKIDRTWVANTLETPPVSDALNVANALLHDTMKIRGLSVKIPIDPHGGWKWNFTGPEQDDEFGYSLNGHRYLSTLVVANEQFDNKDYIKACDRILKDWIIHHPIPSKEDSIYVVLDPTKYIDWRDIGEVEWRTLEAGQRLGATWPQLFYAFQEQNEFSPAARLLMLSSIYDQATYLQRYHKVSHNWTTMEMNGLALAGLAFPEFKDSEKWTTHALKVMSEEINRQVYPDGVQTELSTKTQWVALRRFESVAENFGKANQELPESYFQRLEEMYDYLAYSMRPDGHQPLNSDSDRDDLRERVLKASEKFDRPDWQWIATNGQTGLEPSIGPSITFPWAGIHITRDGWGKEASWSFFDVGAYGTGHQHRDKLHLSIASHGKDFLVDGGRYTHKDYFSFDPKVWRGYFRSSFSHNVILVNGNGQKAGATRMRKPLVEGVDYVHNGHFDYAFGTFLDGYENVEGKAIHNRSVLYFKKKYWIVLDHFVTDRPRKLEVLWHYAPDCEVSFDDIESIATNKDATTFRIIPIGNIPWKIKKFKGQTKPYIQGWYSAEYDLKEPNPTVVYSTDISHTSTFAWLLVATPGIVPGFNTSYKVENGNVMISISDNNQSPIVITLPVEMDASKVLINSQ